MVCADRASAMKSLTDKVEELLAEWSKLDIPGCVLGVINTGLYVCIHGYEMANLGLCHMQVIKRRHGGDELR